MTRQIADMFNKIKDDEISYPEFLEWVGNIMDHADSAGYSKGYDDGYSAGFDQGEYVGENN